MNKVNFSEQSASKPQVGSIWKDKEDYYILAQGPDMKYVYIGLDSGYYWDKPFTDINDTQGLTFVTNEANITITPI